MQKGAGNEDSSVAGCLFLWVSRWPVALVVCLASGENLGSSLGLVAHGSEVLDRQARVFAWFRLGVLVLQHRKGRGVRLSVIEALANAVIGLLVSWAVTFALLPLWGYSPSAVESAGITAMYFFISFARSWAIREVFRRVSNNS